MASFDKYTKHEASVFCRKVVNAGRGISIRKTWQLLGAGGGVVSERHDNRLTSAPGHRG